MEMLPGYDAWRLQSDVDARGLKECPECEQYVSDLDDHDCPPRVLYRVAWTLVGRDKPCDYEDFTDREDAEKKRAEWQADYEAMLRWHLTDPARVEIEEIEQ